MEITDKTTETGDFKVENNGANNARERILAAARRVFSVHSFKTASTRMIAREAGVDHPLIHYYFGSKDKLFEQVCHDIYDEFWRAFLSWMDGLDKVEPSEGFPIFVDRVIEYTFSNPEPLQLIFQNIVQLGSLEEIPGSKYLKMHIENVRNVLSENLRTEEARSEIEIFVHSFVNFIITFLGARSGQALLLDLEPESGEYREWVKNAILLIFHPWVKKLAATEEARP